LAAKKLSATPAIGGCDFGEFEEFCAVFCQQPTAK
jgi:hypothetical protein